jgi:hypothetical protein
MKYAVNVQKHIHKHAQMCMKYAFKKQLYAHTCM